MAYKFPINPATGLPWTDEERGPMRRIPKPDGIGYYTGDNSGNLTSTMEYVPSRYPPGSFESKPMTSAPPVRGPSPTPPTRVSPREGSEMPQHTPAERAKNRPDVISGGIGDDILLGNEGDNTLGGGTPDAFSRFLARQTGFDVSPATGGPAVGQEVFGEDEFEYGPTAYAPTMGRQPINTGMPNLGVPNVVSQGTTDDFNLTGEDRKTIADAQADPASLVPIGASTDATIGEPDSSVTSQTIPDISGRPPELQGAPSYQDPGGTVGEQVPTSITRASVLPGDANRGRINQPRLASSFAGPPQEQGALLWMIQQILENAERFRGRNENPVYGSRALGPKGTFAP